MKLAGSLLFPFLNTGATGASFHSLGKDLDCKDELKMSVRTRDMSCAVFFLTWRACMRTVNRQSNPTSLYCRADREPVLVASWQVGMAEVAWPPLPSQSRVSSKFPSQNSTKIIPGVLCQKQLMYLVSRAGTSNYIPQYLWDVITWPCFGTCFWNNTYKWTCWTNKMQFK